MASELNKFKRERDRFVGFAFSAAECLLELSEDLKIVFVTGAHRHLDLQDKAVQVGASFLKIVSEDDRTTVQFALKRLSQDGRLEPMTIHLGQEKQPAILGACRLPQVGNRFFVTLSAARPKSLSPSNGAQRSLPSGAWDQDDFAEIARTIIEDAREQGRQEKLTLMQLSGFDDLKDRSGEACVENILRESAGFLRSQSVLGDAVGQLGSDRFGVIHHSAVAPSELADGVGRIAQDRDANGPGLTVKQSCVDLAVGDLGADDIERVLLYTFKTFAETAAGEFEVSSLSEAFDGLLHSNIARLSTLKRAVAGKEFRLVYQPIVSLADRSAHHYEVLSRNPNGESPFETLRFAEKLGAIEEFDLMVFQNTIKILRGRHAKRCAPELSVNISGRSLTSRVFVSTIRELLAQDSDLRRYLLLEITETSRIEDLDLAQDRLQELRSDGLRVCLDDFGSGAASFRYLQALTVDYVKIDGSFVKKMATDDRDLAIVKSMVSLCHEIGVHTVAEMVETENQASTLQALGIDYGQGWLFGKPQPQIPTSIQQDSEDISAA